LLYQLPATNKGRRNTVGWKKYSWKKILRLAWKSEHTNFMFCYGLSINMEHVLNWGQVEVQLQEWYQSLGIQQQP
jgi:hypothetical protein